MKTLRLILAATVLTISCNLYAATDSNGSDKYYHHVGVTGELTSNFAWQLEVSYHWFPIKYVGVGASVGTWKQIDSDDGPWTTDWRLTEDSHNISNVFLMPSLLLVSPAIIKTENLQVGVMGQPGFMMNIPYNQATIEITSAAGIPMDYKHVSNNNGRWYAFSLRIGVYVTLDRATISAGYAYSDLDIYSMRRNMRFENIRFDEFYPKKKAIGGAFLSVACSF